MNKSFTLIEILVVIVVIGVLSAFILVGMSSITSSANIAKSQSFANSMRNSLLMNLVSEWKLDGNANDSWGVNAGTWSGTTAPNTVATYKSASECVNGQCLDFDGVDDTVSCGNNSSLNIANQITLLAWIRPDIVAAGTGQDVIVRPWSGDTRTYEMRIYDVVRFYLNNDGTVGGWKTVDSTTTLQPSKWYLIAGTFNGTIMKIYINGEERGSATFTAFTIYCPATPTSLVVGSLNSSQYFNGLMDDIRIYNAAIPAYQIEQNYYSGLNNLIAKGSIDKEEYNNRLMAIK
jgi:large repetitive protein